MDGSWQAELRDKLGICTDILDADHQRCNRLVIKMIEFSDSVNMRFEIFEDLLTELKNYVVTHYEREEAFMEISAYPSKAQHMAEHSQHLEHLSHVSDALLKGDQATVNRLMRSIFDTWREHRRDQDNKLNDFIHNL